MGFDMSDPGTFTQNRPFDGDDMYRCRQCQRWFNRSDALSVAEHRGPLPHPVQNPRTAWADEDDGVPD
jgi:hypothetical protein